MSVASAPDARPGPRETPHERPTAAMVTGRSRAGRVVEQVVVYGLLGLVAFLMLFPFTWVLSLALKTPPQAFIYPPALIPDPVSFENFGKALFGPVPFLLFFQMGYASALSVILFLVILAFTAVLMTFSDRWVQYDRI